MKQTNNAIKFLMAQYRAIFKHANLAMAVALATAALATTQAQAAGTVNNQWDAGDFDSSNATSSGAESITVSQNFDMSALKDGWNYSSGDSIVSGAGVVLDITGAANKHLALENLKVSGGAALRLNNTAQTNTQIFGYASGSDAGSGDRGTLTVDNGTVEINKGSINLNKAEVSNGSTLTLGGIVDYNKKADNTGLADWKHYSNISTVTSGSNSGSFGVSGSTINMNHESLLYSQDAMTLSGSALNFVGQKHTSGFATAMLIGSTDSGSVAITDDSTISVNGHGAIYSGEIEISDSKATISDGGSLILDGRFEDTTAANAGKHKDAAITLNNFTVTGGGTLVLGNATSNSTVTIKAGNNDDSITTVNSNLLNYAAINVSDSGDNSGALYVNGGLENHGAISVSGDDAEFSIRGSDFKKDAGLFAGKNSSIVLSDEGTLIINDKTSTIELTDKNQIEFASGSSGAQNKIVVSGSANLATLGTFSISKAVEGLNGADLHVGAENLILGADDYDSNKGFGIGDGELFAKNVTFKSTGDTFVLKNNLILGEEGLISMAGESFIKGKVTTSGGDISILAGIYTANDGFVLSSGGMSIEDTELTVGGVLKSTANGKLEITDAAVKASNATIDFADKSVELSGDALLVLNGGNLIKITDTAGDNVQFQNGLLATSISGDNKSTIQLDNMGSMTLEQFQELKKDATGFSGSWTGISISGAPAAPSLGLDQVESGLDGYYDKTQVSVSGSTAIDDTYTVGNIKVTDGANVSVSGGSLILNNASANGVAGMFVQNKDGGVGGVSLKGNSSFLTLRGTGTVGDVTVEDAGSNRVIIGNVNLVEGKSGNVTVAGDIGASDKNLGGLEIGTGSTLTVEGDVYVKNLYAMPNTTVNLGENDLYLGSGAARLDTEVADINGNLTANTITVVKGTAVFAGGGKVQATIIKGDQSSVIQVGEDAQGGLGSTVIAGTLDLNGGTLFVDPDFDAPASTMVLEKLAGTTLNGKATVGKNAILAIGFDNEEDVKRVLSQYLDDQGRFTKGAEVQNALLLNQGIALGATDKIIIDPEATAGSSSNAAVAFGAGSALVVTDKVYTVGADGKKTGYAIKLDTNASSVDASKGGSVILSGKFNAGDKGLTIFSGGNISAGATGLTVKSANGLINGTIGNSGVIDTLELEQGKLDSQMASVSAPVRELYKKLLSATGDQYLKGNGVGAELLMTIGTDSMTGVEADAAAHAATYAGAQVAAVSSVVTMAEAVGGRVGAMGVETSVIQASGNQANGGVWLSPMYKSVDADGFNAQGASYGSDVDLAGVAFGADAVKGNMRFGAVFNIGSGDAEGKGNGSGLKDEFDYYGFGIYSAMGFGQMALVADASVNVISHDVEGYSGVESFGNLSGKADTTAVTLGLTGQYTFSTPAVDVTPHLGARFIRLDTDSYDLKSAKGTVAVTDFDVQNVFSIPLGVSVSKAFTTGSWTLAPSADLTLTVNTGDTEANSNVKFTGITENLALSSEVLDEVTYGLTLGLGAQSGAFGTSVGINYTGSENTDAFTVNAQARYTF